MKIFVLGTGCKKCNLLHNNISEAVEELDIEATIEKIEDPVKIAEMGVMKTPALIVDEKILFTGRAPTVETLKRYIK